MNKPKTKLTRKQVAFLKQKIAAHVVEEGDCLKWQLCLDGAAPVVNTPRDIGRVSVRVRLFMMEEVYKVPRPGNGRTYFPVAKCGDPKCLAKEHQGWVTQPVMQRMTAERTGYHLNPVRNAKISKTLNRRKLTEDQVATIRSSGTSIQQLARDHDMSFESMRCVVQGTTYKDYSSPWAGLMR